MDRGQKEAEQRWGLGGRDEWEVESGASGFSVTGGGNEGIFVKQVLKGSSASKIFSLREGDQLLSATIFFDNIKYEDALKILQYSEPYKVQFSLKRKLVGKEDLEKIHSTAQHKKEKINQVKLFLGGVADVEVSLKEPQVTMPSARAEGEITLSGPAIQAPSVELEIGTSAGKGGEKEKIKMPDVKLPSVKLPKVKAPQVQVSLPKVEADISLPKTQAEIKEVGFEVKVPDMESSIEVETRKAEARGMKIHMPKVKMPSMGFSKPEIKAPKVDVDVTLPKVDVTLPTCDVSLQEADLKAASVPGDVNISAPRVKIPEIEGSLQLKSPGIDVKAPSAEIVVEGPEVKAAGLEGKIKMPKFEKPKFGVTLPKGKVPEGEISLPKMVADVPKPKVKETEASGWKIQMPSLKMPKMPKADIQAPEVDITLPSVDVSLPKEKGSSGDGEGIVLKMPKVKISTSEFSKPEIKAPKMDVDINLPTVDVTLPTYDMTIQQADLKLRSAGVDVSLSAPDIKIPTSEGSVELQSPETGVEGISAGIAVEGAKMKVEGLEGKIKMPEFQKPKFGISRPKGKVPESEISLPKMEADVPQLKAMTDIADIAVEAPTVEVESAISNAQTESSDWKIKMPKIPEADIKTPKVDINLQSNVSVPMAEIGIQDSNMASKATKVEGEIKPGDTEMEGKEGHFKLPKFKLPSFSWSPKKEASIKADFEAPREEPKITVSSGKTDTKLAEIVTEDQGPSMDLDIEISTGKEEQKSQIKKPQFIMPKISFSKIKAPKSQVNLPKVEADITVPKPERDGEDLVQIPDIESSHTKSIEEGAQISIKMPKVQIPTLEFSKPEIKVPKSDMGISLPKVDATFPTYDASLQQADLKSESAGDDVRLSRGIKFPTAEASIELKSPETGIEGPLAVDGAEVKVEGLEGKIKMPKFQTPMFGISLPKGKRPESEISLPKMKAGVPQLTTIDIADIAVEAPILDAKSDVSDAEIEVSTGKMKMPQVSITDIKAPEMGVSLPSVSVSTTEVAIQSAEVEDMKVQGEHEMKSGEIQTEEYQGWFKMPKFRMPTFGRSSSKEKRGDIDSEGSLEKPQVSAPSAEMQTEIEAPEYTTSLPHVDTEPAAGKAALEGKIKSAKAEIPKVGVSLHKGKSSDVTSSKFEAEVSLPPEKAVIKSPEIGAKAPSVEIALDGTQKKLDVLLPKVELDILHPGAGVKTEKLGGVIKSTRKDVQGRESKLKMPTFSVPSLGWPATKGTGDVADVKTNLEETRIGAL
uniref:PDZ domain-containing protein n=1 Tax=Chelydra serpentina TaxID=8475 RepID=A0A8C3SRV0_CHESE